MSWFKVSPRLTLHPKTIRAGSAAMGLWVLCGSWKAANVRAVDPVANEAPPRAFIPHEVARQFGTPRNIRALVDAELWQPCHWQHVKGHLMTQEDVLWRITLDDWRPSIPEAVRAFVMTRDGHQCLDCGDLDDLTLDHIYPWSRGGADTPENLRVLCRSCNSRKGARVDGIPEPR